MNETYLKILKKVKKTFWVVTPSILLIWAIYAIHFALTDDCTLDPVMRVLFNGKTLFMDHFMHVEKYIMTQEQVSKLLDNPNQEKPLSFNVIKEDYDGQLYYVIRLWKKEGLFFGVLVCYLPTKEIYRLDSQLRTNDYQNFIIPVPVKASELKKLGSNIKTKWSHLYWGY